MGCSEKVNQAINPHLQAKEFSNPKEQPWETTESSETDEALPELAGPIEDEFEDRDDKLRQALDPENQIADKLNTEENLRAAVLAEKSARAREAVEEAEQTEKNRASKQV